MSELKPAAKSMDSQESPDQLRESRKRRREWMAVAILGVLFLGLTLAEFRLTRVSATLPLVNSIFFFGLLNLNIVILIAIVWLVSRNVGKLFIERRRKVLGSSLKTKLVVSFLSFSIIPTVVLFIISALYINSSFDKWFSIKIENTLEASLEITRTYYKNTEQTAMHFSEHLAAGIGKSLGEVPGHQIAVLGEGAAPRWLERYLESQRDLLALDAIEYYPHPIEDRFLITQSRPGKTFGQIPRLPLEPVALAFRGEKLSVVEHVGSGDLIRCLSPVSYAGQIVGVVVVNSYIPVSLVNKVDEISGVFEDYKDTNPLKYPVKTAYLVILVMITLVILFVAIWIGLYIARELTVPVERLVQGARAVGAGDLDVTVKGVGHDEIAVLVDSFNRMTGDLRENRERLTIASRDLEKRRAQLEAVLAAVGTGVIVAERSGEIRTFNRAIAQILGKREGEMLGRNFRVAFAESDAKPVADVMEEALQRGRSAPPEVAQWNRPTGDATQALACVATALVDLGANEPWGVVAVVDDLSHLVKAQREMAWREVARRIAHEIKNPLTPIKLSAQRLQRRLSALKGPDGELLRECTTVIIQHVDEMKDLVNEFSDFARLPEINPAPNDLNAVGQEVLRLYQQAHPFAHFELNADDALPIFDFDRDQLKRALINLLDNAVSALISQSKRAPAARKNQVAEVSLSTRFDRKLGLAILTVRDNGPGMDESVLDRVFEPYFSTKADGTGLGLAIVKRIINDHDGVIRVTSRPSEGTEFTIELPTVVTHRYDRVDAR